MEYITRTPVSPMIKRSVGKILISFSVVGDSPSLKVYPASPCEENKAIDITNLQTSDSKVVSGKIVQRVSI